MNANLDKLNQWLTIFANLGVLVGILFLVIEIRQNTDAIRIDSESARFSISEAALGPAAYNRQVTEVLVSVGKFIEDNGSENLDIFYNTDHRQFQNIVFRRVSYLQFRYSAYPQERDSLKVTIASQLEQPGFLEIFNTYPFGVASEDFKAFVQEAIEEQEIL